MSFFRRASEPTKRETFLMQALAAIGMTAEQVSAAEAANETNFLDVLAVNAKELEKAKADLVTAQASLKSATGDYNRLADILRDNGYKAEDLTTVEAFKAAEKKRTAAAAVDICAARGIAPVPAGATIDGNSTRKTMARADFNKLSPHEQMEFSKSGGQLT